MHGTSGELNLCTKCIGSASFSEWIGSNGRTGRCDFDVSHGSRQPVATIEEFAQEVDRHFRQNYQLGEEYTVFNDDSDSPSYETYGDTYENILAQDLDCDDKIIKAIGENLPDYNHREIQKGAEPFYVDWANYESIEDAKTRDREEAEDNYSYNEAYRPPAGWRSQDDVGVKTIRDAPGLDPKPVEGVDSLITIVQLPDGRIGADPMGAPDPSPLLTSEDLVRLLSACRDRAGRLLATASAQGFQGRRDYAEGITTYLEWLPDASGSGNILLADGEMRSLSKLFTADAGILPTGFAVQLEVFLEDHIGLRIFYPELERHYLAVRTGRLVVPLERDAIEGIKRAIRENTPSVFHESVGTVMDATAKTVPEVMPPRPEDAPTFDPNYPRPPKDPTADIDVANSWRFIFASTANRIWQVLLRGKDLATAIDGWHKTYEQIKPHIGTVLNWLRQFVGDGGIPPMPPTIST